MKNTIFSDKFFYHIYPLGLFNCPEHNDFSCPAGNGFEKLSGELPRLKELGVNALYIGPVFESTKHGYDTVDYYNIDRRLGNNEKFSDFCKKAHDFGFSIVLDAVFNHTGRDFFAFKDIQQNGENSPYKDWYLNLHFGRRSAYGDNFDYDGWAGCKDLVKLNVENHAVQEHIFGAVKFWIDNFKIDGIRLDAADVLSKSFLDNLSLFCKSINQNFWLMGEVVHGDYNDWAKENRLDSVTNYQLYKGMWSSFNDGNFFEVAYNLNREFGDVKDGGLYNYSSLYNFLDNHDVNRIASTVNQPEFLYPLYGMLFTVPGIPSIYYGSEYGIKGKRTEHSDKQLRPSLPPFSDIPDYARPETDSKALSDTIKKFSQIRKENAELQIGSYHQIAVQNKQFMYSRSLECNETVVAINSGDNDAEITNNLTGIYRDLITGEEFTGDNLTKLKVSPFWLRILKKI